MAPVYFAGALYHDHERHHYQITTNAVNTALITVSTALIVFAVLGMVLTCLGGALYQSLHFTVNIFYVHKLLRIIFVYISPKCLSFIGRFCI